jgi:two-component sensor histidine kinase
MDDVRLALTEVVTNAVRHGNLRQGVDPLRITVDSSQDGARVTVEQPTAAEGVAIREPALLEGAPGGFGLRFVDHVADSWGHDPGPPGRVWFEFGKS